MSRGAPSGGAQTAAMKRERRREGREREGGREGGRAGGERKGRWVAAPTGRGEIMEAARGASADRNRLFTLMFTNFLRGGRARIGIVVRGRRRACACVAWVGWGVCVGGKVSEGGGLCGAGGGGKGACGGGGGCSPAPCLPALLLPFSPSPLLRSDPPLPPPSPCVCARAWGQYLYRLDTDAARALHFANADGPWLEVLRRDRYRRFVPPGFAARGPLWWRAQVPAMIRPIIWPAQHLI